LIDYRWADCIFSSALNFFCERTGSEAGLYW
jgi:hypothetical protein